MDKLEFTNIEHTLTRIQAQTKDFVDKHPDYWCEYHESEIKDCKEDHGYPKETNA